MSKFESDSLGNRMKSYENISATKLNNEQPVIIRVDGKAFHTYTRGCLRPFDITLNDVMIDTAIQLCKNIQGAKMAYVQSDEISLLVCNHLNKLSQPWFDYKLQKVCSISAAIASATFTAYSNTISSNKGQIVPAYFDARAFNIPENEVINYFIWRQQDNVRNSVQMLARSLFSHKSLNGLSCAQLKQKCLDEKNVSWEDDTQTRFKHGVCIERCNFISNDAIRHVWKPDFEIPIFNHNRNYVEKFLITPEDEHINT